MKNINSTLLFVVFSFFSLNTFGQVFSSRFGQIDPGNIKARFRNNGTLFFSSDSQNYFEVPKNSGKTTIYNSSIWMAGKDQNNQIHAGRVTYGQYFDFFQSGPIDSLTHIAANNRQWDHVWCIEKASIDQFKISLGTPGYVIPNEILTWPGNGYYGYSKNLAPYKDLNSNGIYEPRNGEYPDIKGDEFCFIVNNDLRREILFTNEKALGVEIHTSVYSFNASGYLLNVIFVEYDIINRSLNTYSDFYIGHWSDLDIGNPSDDYVGTDVGRNMIYGYNGDNDDEGVLGYGLNPPAQGYIFLNKPLSYSMYFNNAAPEPQEDVSNNYEGFLALQGKWRDGNSQTFGGDGYDTLSTNYANYIFPGTTDPAHPGQDWSEISEGNLPSDRRVLGSTGPYLLAPNQREKLTIAYLFSRGTSGNSVAELKADADLLNP